MFLEYNNLNVDSNSITPMGICWGCEKGCFLRCIGCKGCTGCQGTCTSKLK
ncbi:MAG: hypothetical protein HFJ44_02270 [Clostridia bacterium]|nr:hypothetical protein [Clostridia bacterium]